LRLNISINLKCLCEKVNIQRIKFEFKIGIGLKIISFNKIHAISINLKNLKSSTLKT